MEWVFCTCTPVPDRKQAWKVYHADDCPAIHVTTGQYVIDSIDSWRYYFGHLILPPAAITLAWARRLRAHNAAIITTEIIQPYQARTRSYIDAYFDSWRYDRDKYRYYRAHGYPVLRAISKVIAEYRERHK